MTEEVKEVKEEVKPSEDWMTKKWRPMMAIMYMICCVCDFALFPILFTIVQFWEVQASNDAFRQWVPITLQGGGLFHVAMGAVLGVTAYGRTQEKVAGVSGATGVASPQLTMNPVTTAAPIQRSYGMQPQNQQYAQYDQQPINITVGYGGKAAPPPAPQPLI